MPFLPPESTTYINIKLTDTGRRMLSLGQLQFSKAVLSDREIDYGIDRTGTYDIVNNRILAPVDDYPNVDPINLDGTIAVTLTNQDVLSLKQFNTAQTKTIGFFSGFSNNWQINDTADYILGRGTITPTGAGSDTVTLSTAPYTPKENDLVYVTWVSGTYPTNTPFEAPSTTLFQSGNSFYGLWYKIYTATTNPNEYILDRPTPDFTPPGPAAAFIFQDNAIETYYGTGSTQETKFWNMNIVRTHTVAGTDTTIGGVSGFSSYGSIEYAGTKHYLGFDEDYPAIGIIHYTNKFSGQTYGEQLIEKSIIINIPYIMWNNFPATNGQGVDYGLTLYDNYGTTIYDALAMTTYRELRDGIQSTNKVVGRVYHKLQLFVITDQDLLQVLTYKGNRNYTLPEPIINLVSNPKPPLTTLDVQGLCQSGKTYFVTYLMESDPAGANSYGFTYPIHCGHIKKIDGEVDINGNPQYLSVQFPTNSFPYMRNDADLIALGTGWNAQRMRIMINEQDQSFSYGTGNVPFDDWVILSGEGSFDCTITPPVTTNTIDPVVLNSFQFIISREDFNTGNTYTMWTGHTSYQNTLNFGDESFFFGTIDAQVFNTIYKTVITVVAANFQYNSSTNDTYNSLTDEYTYITEVAILDNQNQTVAVGKPTYPLRKADSRYLSFQLQIDF